MRMRAVLLAGLVAAVLAACSPPASQTPGESADNSAAGGAPAGANQMQPGQYRTTVTILDMTMPGVPAAAMAQMHAQPFTTEYCVDATDVSDMSMRNMNDSESGMTCTAVRTNSSGGRIDNEATCTGPMGTMTMQMTGTYSPTRVDIETNSTTQMQQGTMTQRSRMVSERIGDCPAATPAAP
ncbi:MAG: DUF3617 family protein [Hyphomonadaceae bacterium]|nr:DUF3617 family protein [Hyphomonadaceae bacterium]